MQGSHILKNGYSYGLPESDRWENLTGRTALWIGGQQNADQKNNDK